MSKEILEEAAERLAENVRGFEERTLQKIGERIKKVGYATRADQKAIENLADIGKPTQEIYADLAAVTEYNISQIEGIFESEMLEQIERSKALYLAKGVPFLDYAHNDFAKKLVAHWAAQTAGEMKNLSRTIAIGFTANDGFHDISDSFYRVTDKAIASISTGVTDFTNAMYDSIKELGGSGIVMNYGSGVTRQLDSMTRQWLLYGAKQAAQSYQQHVGDELGCDGFEVDYHPHPRPSHAFMGGKMFSYHGKVRIGGVTYPDGTEALRRLNDYNCLHFYVPVILGVSEPTWDSKELARMKAEDERLIEYNGIYHTKYEWSQKQRQIERLVRKEKRINIAAKAAGNEGLARESNQRIRVFRKGYDDLCEKVGLQPTVERMRVSGFGRKPLTSGVSGGIIKPETKRNYITFRDGNAINDFFYYDDTDNKGIFAKKNSSYGKWKKNLSEDSKEAIYSYTGSGYGDVNTYLRKLEGWEYIKADMVEDQFVKIDEAVSTFELKKDIRVQRGAQEASLDLLFENNAVNDLSDLIGKTYTDNGYMSTTVLYGNPVATTKPVVFDIDIPAGVGRGAYINEFGSQFEDVEYEFLIKRGAKFIITDVSEDIDLGKIFIKMVMKDD